MIAINKLLNWISTRYLILIERNEPFGSSLEATMPKLANHGVILKFTNFVLVLKGSSHDSINGSINDGINDSTAAAGKKKY